MCLLSVDEINVYYGQVQILRAVSLNIDEGEIVSLLGANGVGKTTTVKAVSGLLKTAQGRIRFQDRDITAMPAHQRVAAGVIQVPEGRKLFPSLSVVENLELGSYLPGPKSQREKTRETMMTMFPVLRHRSNQPAGTLSGGEQQMLALARGLMALPQLFILDEPSLGLAPLVAEEVFSAIEKINDEGTTILLVEQNILRALSLSSRGFVLEEGSVVLAGRGSELAKDDHIKRVYLGMDEEEGRA